MSPQDTAYFWTWYKTGLANGRRSFRKAARILNKGVDTLIEIAETSEPNWYELAEQKDFEIAQRLDEAVIDSILEDAKEVLGRQRLVIREFYKKIVEAIRNGQIEYKLGDIIKLMEYEGRTSGAVRSEAGEALAEILQYVKPDVRSQLHRAYRESRLEFSGDDLLREKLGHTSSN